MNFEESKQCIKEYSHCPLCWSTLVSSPDGSSKSCKEIIVHDYYQFYCSYSFHQEVSIFQFVIDDIKIRFLCSPHENKIDVSKIHDVSFYTEICSSESIHDMKEKAMSIAQSYLFL